MDEIIIKIQEYAPVVLQALGGLVIVATAIVRVTPSPKDDGVVKEIAEKVFKVAGYLPTLGINPNTKKIEDAYKDLKEK